MLPACAARRPSHRHPDAADRHVGAKGGAGQEGAVSVAVGGGDVERGRLKPQVAGGTVPAVPGVLSRSLVQGPVRQPDRASRLRQVGQGHMHVAWHSRVAGQAVAGVDVTGWGPAGWAWAGGDERIKLSGCWWYQQLRGAARATPPRLQAVNTADRTATGAMLTSLYDAPLVGVGGIVWVHAWGIATAWVSREGWPWPVRAGREEAPVHQSRAQQNSGAQCSSTHCWPQTVPGPGTTRTHLGQLRQQLRVQVERGRGVLVERGVQASQHIPAQTMSPGLT